jgi:prepilin peptidase CpaA
MLMPFEGPFWPRLEVLTFAALLLSACVTDLRTRRIPNRVVVGGLVAGLALAIATDGVLAGGGRALGGFATGMAIWMPFWLLHMMGGGDVKFFAAGAMWLGPHGAVEAAMLAGLCGGALSLVYLLARHGFTYTVVRLAYGVQHPSSLREAVPVEWDRRMPYALAMAAGLAGAARWPGLLL